MTTEAWPCHNVAMPIEVGEVRGVTSHVGADAVVFASPVSFAVGTAISFLLSIPADTAAPVQFDCSGVVIRDRAHPEGGFETSATIETIRIVPAAVPISKGIGS